MTDSLNPQADAVRMPAAALQAWAAGVLQAFDVNACHAQATAQALVRTSLRGVDTHGVARLPPYVQRIREGTIHTRAKPSLQERNGLLRCDGDHALGQPVLELALRACLDRVASQAVVACHIEACGHLGALGVLLLPAVDQGCMALLCQRTPSIMAMPGATQPALGNNPIAFAAPVAGRPPLVFDMALSAVARGAVMAAARDGHAQIPSHWALDAYGHPTTDPHAALQGAMQPMAGHKGLGLAMVVECLAGALGGGLFQPAVPGSAEGSAANACAFLLVINPALAAPSPQGFDNYMANWITGLLAAQGTQGRYPGLRQHECELQRRAEGIPLSSALINELQALARLSGVALAL